jgi:hypothetical protein
MTTIPEYVDVASLPDPENGDGIDLDNYGEVLAEMTKTAADAGRYGIRGKERADRIRNLARVSFLANRCAWLEASDLQQEQLLGEPVPARH